MNTLNRRTPALVAASAFALAMALVLLSNAGGAHTTHALQQASAGSYHGPSIDQQSGEIASDDDGDSKVAVQTWTIMASGGAAAVFLLLFFLRMALGRVAPPPPQEDAAHH